MPKPTFERSDRVELVRDCVDAQGLPFKAGQRGEVTGWLNGQVLVDFDGYEEARECNRLAQARHGEGFNVLTWAGVFEAGELRLLDEDAAALR